MRLSGAGHNEAVCQLPTAPDLTCLRRADAWPRSFRLIPSAAAPASRTRRPTSPCWSPAPAIASASSTPTSSRPASTSSFNLPSRASKHALNDYLWGKCAHRRGGLRRDRGRDRQRRSGRRPAADLSDSVERQRRRDRPDSQGRLRRRQAQRRLSAAGQRPASSTTCSSTRIPGVNEETLLSIAISDKLILVMRPDSQDFQGTAVTAELARRLEIPEMLHGRQQGAAGHGHGPAARARREDVRRRGRRDACR